MKKLLLILLLGLILSVSSTASKERVSFLEMDNTELIGKDLPSVIRPLFGNQRINLVLALDSDPEQDTKKELSWGIVTENGVVTNVIREALINPTLIVKTSQPVITVITQSETPFAELQLALQDGRVSYKAVGLVNKVKFSVVKLLARAAGWFYNNRQTASPALTVTGQAVLNPKEQSDSQNKNNNYANSPAGQPVKQTYQVGLTADGFEPDKLTLQKGDTVEWKVERNKPFNTGMIIGVRNCNNIKSKILAEDETFSWTFTKAETCTIVDGIMTTESSSVIVKG